MNASAVAPVTCEVIIAAAARMAIMAAIAFRSPSAMSAKTYMPLETRQIIMDQNHGLTVTYEKILAMADDRNYALNLFVN